MERPFWRPVSAVRPLAAAGGEDPESVCLAPAGDNNRPCRLDPSGSICRGLRCGVGTSVTWRWQQECLPFLKPGGCKWSPDSARGSFWGGGFGLSGIIKAVALGKPDFDSKAVFIWTSSAAPGCHLREMSTEHRRRGRAPAWAWRREIDGDIFGPPSLCGGGGRQGEIPKQCPVATGIWREAAWAHSHSLPVLLMTFDGLLTSQCLHLLTRKWGSCSVSALKGMGECDVLRLRAGPQAALDSPHPQQRVSSTGSRTGLCPVTRGSAPAHLKHLPYTPLSPFCGNPAGLRDHKEGRNFTDSGVTRMQLESR